MSKSRKDLNREREEVKALLGDRRFRDFVRRFLVATGYDEVNWNGLGADTSAFHAGKRAASVSLVASLQAADPKAWAVLVLETMTELEERQLNEQNSKDSTNG